MLLLKQMNLGPSKARLCHRKITLKDKYTSNNFKKHVFQGRLKVF